MSDWQDEGRPRGPLRVTISDVASEAGVSRATATRALKGEGRFAEATRQRILAVSERLGYVPNTMAAELAAGRTGTVGLLLRDASNPAYGLLFSRLQEEAHLRRMELVTMTIGADTAGAKQISALQRLLGMRVAGLIVATGGVTSEQLLPFADEVPILRAGRPETGERIHAVSYDEQRHGELLAGHIVGLGHRRVAVLATDPAASFPEHVRATAMLQRLTAAGVDAAVVPVGAAADDGVADVLRLAARDDITAVLASSDYRQLAVLRAARAAGIDVPGRLSVTGCDGILPGADLLGLTTVRIPVEPVAHAAVESMARLLAGDPASSVVRQTFAGPLVPGATTSPPRA